jgi:general nucleoside transport system ATP-binding protein
MKGPLLQLRGLTKRFPGVVANADVSLDVARGEIHALLGENGAGKSTLVKMIYGIMRPDEGQMVFNGAPYAPASPADARARGIGIVFQHFSLFEAMTVTENIALGLPAAEVNRDLPTRIVKISTSYGLQLDPERLVGTLSVGERQRVEIVRCLLQNPRLLIMDEPTSVLTPTEVDMLFATLRRLSFEGCSILYISHKLEEIRALCTNATILRAGRVVTACDPRAESARSLAEMMIGTALQGAPRPATSAGSVRFEVSGLSLASEEQFGTHLADIGFEVCAGEIFGIAGVAGNGQSELMDALTGERTLATPESITVDGKAIGHLGPAQRRARGMSFVPEERLGHAAVPDLSLTDNTLLAADGADDLVARGWINQPAAKRFAERIVSTFDVRTAGVGHTARSLSGGNLQKFVVGREIMRAPAILIVAQPTWGVDAGATVTIHRALLDLAAKGCAIVVISQDLDELFALSTRIAVIAQGRLSAATPIADVTIETIGRAMGGEPAPRASEAAHA